MSSRGGHALFILLFLNFLLYGGVTTVVGATLPSIIRDFGWSYLSAGTVLASGTVGYFLTTFGAGLAITRIGPRRLIVAGLFLQAVGIGFFGSSPQILFNMGALILLGIGQGTTEVVTNYSVVQMEPAGQSRLMNLMHSAFTIGAIAAPFALGILIDVADQWRAIYRVMAGLSLVTMLALRRGTLPFVTSGKVETVSFTAFTGLLRQPLLGLLTVIILLYVGAEMGISSWISELYVSRYGASAAVGAYMVSTFWLGIFLGRLLTSAVYRGKRQPHLLVGFSLFAAVGLLLALRSKSSVVAGVMFFATGLGFSAIYPIVMAIVGNTFAKKQGMAIGVVTTGGGLGACMFPFVMSVMANALGIQSGFWFYLLLTGIMGLAALGVLLRSPRLVRG